LIDWPAVINELRLIFGSYRNIARLVHSRHPDGMAKLARGEVMEPFYSVGAALVELYAKHISEDVPKMGQPRQKRLIK
jgi:hypothetical protein